MVYFLIISGFIGVLLFPFLVSMWKINYAPNSWRRMMLRKIYVDTKKHWQRGATLQIAHNIAIDKWYTTCLNSGNQRALMLFTEMMQDEFPKQIEILCKEMYGENYNVKYGHIKNKDEMLEIVKLERAATGDISNLEKMCIDKVIPALPPMETVDEINKNIPHILLGTEEMGLPITFEEINAYLKKKLGIKHDSANVAVAN